jgi:tetratricopeptide (TPR) repeat protein
VDAGRLIRGLVGDALPVDLEERVAERSDGNPLFIEELLRTWVSVGALAREATGWRLASPAADVPLPPTVQAIYAGQIDDLPTAARQVARRASVAGRRFPERALDPLEVSDWSDGLETLVLRAFLGSVPPDPLLGPAFAYRHALLRDAGYASLGRAERSSLHARLARWLEEAAGTRHGELAELIATHYASALESAPGLARQIGEGLSRDDARRLAAGWFERAAESALAVAAHDAARTLFRRALDHTDDDEVLDRARRWERLGDATAFAGDMDEGGGALERATALFGSVTNDPSATNGARLEARSGYARATASLGKVWCEQIRFEDAVRLADEALDNMGQTEDAQRGRLLYLRAWATYCFQIVPRVEEDLDLALGIARQTGDRELELEATSLLNGLLGDLGKISRDEVLAREQQVGSLAARLGVWPRACRALRFNGNMLVEDRAEEAVPFFDRAAALAEAHGLMEELAWIDYGRSEVGFVSGDWDGAVESGLRAIELAERNAYHRPIVRTWFVLVAIASMRGRRDLIDRAALWFEAERDRFPPSPYGNFMHGAMNAWFRQAGFDTPRFRHRPTCCRCSTKHWDCPAPSPRWRRSVRPGPRSGRRRMPPRSWTAWHGQWVIRSARRSGQAPKRWPAQDSSGRPMRGRGLWRSQPGGHSRTTGAAARPCGSGSAFASSNRSQRPLRRS